MTITPDSSPSSPALSRGVWTLDPAQSRLRFRTRMLGVIPVTGRYGDFSGTLRVDPSGEATGELQIEAATLTTGIRKRDEHLRSEDFFDVEAHPHLTFALTGLEPATDGTAQLAGTLHILDRELAIDTPVTLAAAGSRGLRITAGFEIDHTAAGFAFKRLPRRVRIEASMMLEPAGDR